MAKASNKENSPPEIKQSSIVSRQIDNIKTPEPIAIIGIGCRYPGDANSPDELWELLRNGVDAISDVPEDRWSLHNFYDSDPLSPGKTYVRKGGFIKNIDQFDAQFFGISPREASRMDPQQRLMLEVAYEAMEDAGLQPERLSGSKTGVFVGISTYDYGGSLSTIEARRNLDAYSNLGGALSIAANRISYVFNFKGPSFSVDTACSSALVATHLACQSIWNGECSLAMSGGVNVTFRPETTIGFSKAALLAPDGRCKSFDARADGYGRSEGAGMVILKPLSAALADGNLIYALIRGTAVNQDGRTAGIALPNRWAQRAVLEEAYRKAGVSPEMVQYLEAHGTGTPAGDPIEAKAIGRVLGTNRQSGKKCIVGSIKSNIGHMEAASGVAGLIKVALCLKHKQIPPSLHFETPNPQIPFEKLKLRIPTKLEPWPENTTGPRLAGVNSFGFGGTNCHVVLEETPEIIKSQPVQDTQTEGKPLILPLTARSPEALRALVQSYSEFLSENGGGTDFPMSNICYTAGVRRGHHNYRLAVVAFNKKSFIDNLEAFQAGETRMWMSSGHKHPTRKPKLVFVFSGMGPQWWAMGRELIETEPLVQEKIKQCDELLKQYTDWSLWEELTAKEAESRIHETHISQPAIFALQVALASLWGSWGIKPDAITGHSVGEVAAAHVSGALNLEDAVLLIYHRSRLQARAAGQGKMLAASLSEEKTKSMIASYREQVSIAAVNGPQSVTLAGNASALEEIANHLEREEVFWRFLKVDAPFHSSAMDQIKEELLESLSDLDPRPSTIPIYSTALGKAIEGSEMDASYWWQNVRNPVHFKAAIDQLIEKDHFVFIEISSHPVLAASIMECAEQFEAECLVLPSLRRQEPELPLLYGSLGALYTYGFSIEWHLLFSQGRRQVPLPAYPWQRERFWHETEEIIKERIKPNHPLLGKRVKSAYPTWNEVIDRRCLKYLDDHRIQGAVVYPAAAYVEMALSAAKETFGSNVCIIENIQFQKILFLADDEPPTVELILDRAQTAFEIYSKKPGANSQWIRHVSGEILYTEKDNVSALLPLNEIRQRCHKQTLKNDYYSQFLEFGLQYGPMFQGIEQLWSGANEALGQIHVHELLEADIEKYQIHPAILDACFQVLMGAVSMNESDTGRKNLIFLPVQIDRIRVYGQLDLQVWSYARLTEQSETGLKGDIQIIAEDGTILAEIRGISCKPVEGTHKGDTENIDQYLYQYRWKLQPRLKSGTCFYPADYLPSPLEISTYLKPAAEQLSKQLSRNEYYEKIVPHSSELCALYVLNTFKQLGWTWELNQRISVEMLKERLGVTDQNHRLIRRILQMLEEDGILNPTGDQWDVVRLPEIIDPNEMWRSFIQKYPAYLAELFLLQRFGTNLTKILNGRIDPLTLIFSEGSTSITEQLYQDSPSNRVYNRLLQKTFTHILKYLPQGRTVRILEIGAGTGGATAYVLPTLPENSTEYVFTDISQQFMSAAEQKFKNYPFMQYRVLDIESEPIEQGYQEHSFDLILASNVLHATSDLRVTLENVIKLLAPQGMMVLIEVTQQSRTADLIFGSLKGWWRFTDSDLRPFHPLLSWPKWRDLLSDMGFSEVARLSDVQNDEEGELSVILAQCPESQPGSPGDSTFLPALQEDPGKWLIFADHQGIAQQLAERFKELEEMPILILPGRTYQQIDKEQFQIRPDHPGDMQQLIETVLDGELACRGIIHLWSIDAPSSEDTTISTLNSTGERVWYNVIYLIQALENVGLSNPLNFWLVSRGAQAVEDKSAISVEQTPLIGLRRVMINELQNIRTRLIDLSPEISSGEIQALFEELWLDDPEDEVALRGNLRYANRFMGVSLADIKRSGKQPVSEKSRPDEGALTDICPFYLEIGSPGILDSLTFRETKRRKPRRGEVEIRVHATALNFKDVVKAMGLLTETSLEGTSSGKAIGLECAGTIVDVGENVKGLQVGDEVIAFSPNSFATYTTTPARFVRRKPDGLMLEEATTTPLVFITVYYALHHLARIQKGDKILIHAAAGGVGLAAIQLARHAGAEIFATAGTPEKRDFLRAIGVGYVMDSRSLAFADEIMELTGGNGVDIVLNSLAGEALPKSLSILAPYGRFVELGKRDIDQNNKLGLKPFQNNLSFFSVDLDRLCAERPDYVESILEEVMALFENGTLHPLPYRIFPITDVVNAFRHMAQARHIGKVLVSLDSPEFITPHSEEPISFRQDGTYLITGGLGGFGLVVAKWLFENGAGQLVLIGRSGAAKPAVQEAVKSLQKAGMNLSVMKADVSREEDVARVLNEIHKSMPPLRGIIHAAMVLDDESLVKLDRECFHKVIAPKVLGAWNLHAQTLGDPLDYFIMFSSFTSLIGGSMQGNYAAANTFLDMLAHYRRTRNLPALTVNWGAIDDVGYVSENADVTKYLERMGIKGIPSGLALKIMTQLLRYGAVQTAVFSGDLHRWAKIQKAGELPRFSYLVGKTDPDDPQGDSGRGGSISHLIQEAEPAKRQRILESYICTQLSKVLGTSPDKLPVEEPLLNLGVDSLMEIEMNLRIEKELGVRVPPMKFMELSIASMSKVVIEQLNVKDSDTELREE